MAESEISILIQAVDNATATLQTVQGNVSSMANESVKQTEAMSNGFKETTGSLLVIGQAAENVASLFEHYENAQIRVENATDRVMNAEQRLADAKQALTKIQNDQTASAEDVVKAQQDVERASRSLEISQNNLQRANTAVTLGYITMSVQVLSLIASLPTLWTAVVNVGTGLMGLTGFITGTTTSIGLMDLALGPLLLTLGLIAAAIALVIDTFQDLMYLFGKAKSTGFLTSKVMDMFGVDAGGNKKSSVTTITSPDVIKLGDFISRPGQAPVSFSAEDTIVATKGGGVGTTVNITGPIYGVSATNLSRAIAQELGYKLSL